MPVSASCSKSSHPLPKPVSVSSFDAAERAAELHLVTAAEPAAVHDRRLLRTVRVEELVGVVVHAVGVDEHLLVEPALGREAEGTVDVREPCRSDTSELLAT